MIDQDFIRKHLLQRSGLSMLLTPLASLNQAYQKRRRSRYQGHSWHPDCKVVSVGNISSGGSGKTPLCLYLAELLQESGLHVGVSHRGYKGALEDRPTLISDGTSILCGVRDSGDEAQLIARRLTGIPVVVGKQRKAAISLLLTEFPDTDVVVMDDGFQHLPVARDLDLVCFDAQTGIGNGLLLPAGYLREPLSALSEDCILVINAKSGASRDSALESNLAKYSKHVFHFQLHTGEFINPDGLSISPGELLQENCMLISGIGNPASFASAVSQLGIRWLHHFSYPDHHSFSDKTEIEQLAALCQKYKVGKLLCTEKDLLKLAEHSELRPLLLALRVDLRCTAAEKFRTLILNRLGT